MKKIVILTFCILSCFSYVNAQDYNEYLAVARQHLADGNIEKAQKAYSIYCLLSESCSLSFEDELREASAFIETAFGMNMKMVWIEGGEFMMGASVPWWFNPGDDEKKIRRVKLDSYYIGECEVTQEQWTKVMGTSIKEQQQRSRMGGMGLNGVGPDYAMYYVTWEEARQFCEKLSQMTGRNYCLPTEAQWEYAARGGKYTRNLEYSGSANYEKVAWHPGNSDGSTHSVKKKLGNELGLYDMSGNVEEWCSDWYEPEYNENDTNNPKGPISGEQRVKRGGSFTGSSWSCRVSARGRFPSDGSLSCLGFRVVVIP